LFLSEKFLNFISTKSTKYAKKTSISQTIKIKSKSGPEKNPEKKIIGNGNLIR